MNQPKEINKTKNNKFLSSIMGKTHGGCFIVTVLFLLLIILIGVIAAKETKQSRTTETKETAKEGKSYYQVIKVVDGDTIDVSLNGKTERLRLIGIDTPETVDPRKTVQCFGKEASDKAKEMLTGKKVTLEADPTQGDRDKYGRLLRYLFIENGPHYNKWLVENGYAHEYTYNTPYKYQKEFKKAEKIAREGSKGLWSANTCNGDTTKTAGAAPTTTLPIVPTPTTPSTTSVYTCNCSKTCANLSCEEAQYQLDTCGCSARDANKDGMACDSQCQ